MSLFDNILFDPAFFFWRDVAKSPGMPRLFRLLACSPHSEIGSGISVRCLSEQVAMWCRISRAVSCSIFSITKSMSKLVQVACTTFRCVHEVNILTALALFSFGIINRYLDLVKEPNAEQWDR